MALTKPDHGWAWIILGASFGEHAIVGYCQYASGMIYIAFLEKFKAGILQTTWVIALFLALISFAGPLASAIINKFNCRIAMFSGTLIFSVGLIATAFVQDIKWTFFTFGILAGTGLGICYNAGYIVLAFNFEKRRNLACGIAVSGAGIGPFMLTPVYQLIYETYSYTGFFLLLGGLALHNFVFGATLRYSEIESAMNIANQTLKQGFRDSMLSYFEIVRNRSMFCLCFGLFLAVISIFLVYTHFPEYCLQTNSTKMEVSMFLSIAGICGCIGRILFGMASNSRSIDELIMLFGVFSLLGLSTMLFPVFSYSFHAKLMYACILGSYSGCCWTVVSSMVIKILGHDKLAHGIGYLMTYVGIGTLIGPPLAVKVLLLIMEVLTATLLSQQVVLGTCNIFSLHYNATSKNTKGILLIGGAFFGLFSTACHTATSEKAPNMEDYELTVKASEKDELLNDPNVDNAC